MQAQEPVSIHLSEKNGLPDKEFYNIFEDEKGFIWLCADKGLFRYDGKKYKKYTHTAQRALSVFSVQQDPFKRVWCNNISGQFFYVTNNKLTLFIDLNKQLKGELVDFVVNDTYLWVFSRFKILRINLKNKKLKVISEVYKHIGAPYRFNNTIYFQTKGFISSITSDNKIKNVLPTSLLINNKKGSPIGQGKSKIFKVGSSLFLRQNRFLKNVFFQFDVATKSFKSIKGFDDIANDIVYELFNNDNEIWLGTKTGVWVYRLTKKGFKLIKHFLKDKNVTKILKDKDDNFWFTTLNNGIYVTPNINIETSTIKQINKNISSLDKVNDSTLVFGLANGNIGIYDIKKHVSKIIELPSRDRVSAIKYHIEKNIVIVSKDLSSYLISLQTFKYRSNKMFLAIKSFSILENNDLLFTNYINTRFIKNCYFNFKNNTHLMQPKIILKDKRTYTSFYDKKKKETYIAFVDGLIQFDRIWKPRSIQYKNKPIYSKSISKTTNDIVWVASFKDGIYGIKNNVIIHHYSTLNGLTSNNIEKIKADKNKLWIALDNSVQVLDTKTKQIRTLTKSEGVLSYDISGIEIFDKKVYFSSNEGLFSVDKKKAFKTQNPEVYFNTIEINEKDTLLASHYELKYNQNAIKIGFNVNGLLYNKKGKYKYRLKGFNDNWLTTDVGVNHEKYNSLPTGNYTFQVQPIIDNNVSNKKIKELTFLIKKPYWKTWWFLLSIALSVVGSIILYFKNKIKNKEKERIALLEKLSLEKELININLTALRSQMNPHFIFNALNSIQDLVLKQDTDASYDSIVLFSELIRNTLNYSSQDFISIDKELDFLKVYLQLENLRFGDEFKYTISFSSKENLEIPSLLIQPFIENALVHGLLHKKGEKELNINFTFNDNRLQCVITDNGVGRSKSATISNRQGNHHESFALGAIEKRLDIFRKQYNEHIGYAIEDLYEHDIAKGTKVIVTMPFKRKF